jgi:predicted ATPase
VKEETLIFHHGRRSLKLLERHGPHAAACNENGKRAEIESETLASETALGSLQDPTGFPDLHLIRRTLLDWRFYHVRHLLLFW